MDFSKWLWTPQDAAVLSVVREPSQVLEVGQGLLGCSYTGGDEQKHLPPCRTQMDWSCKIVRSQMSFGPQMRRRSRISTPLMGKEDPEARLGSISDLAFTSAAVLILRTTCLSHNKGSIMSGLSHQHPESILHRAGEMAPSVKYFQEWRNPQSSCLQKVGCRKPVRWFNGKRFLFVTLLTWVWSQNSHGRKSWLIKVVLWFLHECHGLCAVACPSTAKPNQNNTEKWARRCTYIPITGEMGSLCLPG